MINRTQVFWNNGKKAEKLSLSPDRSENPFYFSFKNKKIATDSGTNAFQKCQIILLQKTINQNQLLNFETKS